MGLFGQRYAYRNHRTERSRRTPEPQQRSLQVPTELSLSMRQDI